MKNARVIFNAVLLVMTGFSQSAGQVVLSEVMFNPAGSEHHNEFVEIANIGGETADLDGWRIGDGSESDTIVDAGNGLSLEPGQYGLILDADYFSDPAAYAGLIPRNCLVVTISGTTFGNSGFSNSASETATLTDAAGIVRAEYTYNPDNESGYSDEKVTLEGGDDASNWMDGLRYGGTPGFQNSVSKGAHRGGGELIISPNPFSPDGDGYEDEVRIQYHFPLEGGWVNCRIFDSLGRMIRTLAGAEETGASGHFYWDGTDDSGGRVTIGLYIILLEGLNDSAGLRAQLKGSVIVAGR